MLLKDMMSREVPYLRRGETMERAVHLFKQSKIDALPVVGDDMRLVGVFTRTNFFDALLQRASLEDAIDPFVTVKPQSVPWDTPFETVKELVKAAPVGTAPVLDGEGRVCGVLTKANMVMTLLQKSDMLNAQLKAILDAMHNAVVAVDRNKAVTLLNRSAERILGLTADKCVGRPVEELLPGISVDQALSGAARVGSKYTIGNIVTIANIMPISGSGAVDGAVIVLQDLTELEKMARELEIVRELNRTLDTVLNIINDGIVVVDREGVVSLVNQVVAGYLKTTVQDLVGKRVTEVFKNSRLHIVARTGVAELSEIMNVGEDQLIVSRLPVIKNGRTVGAVGKIIFPHLAEIRELASKLNSLQNKLAYYEEELKKNAREGFDVNGIVAVSPPMVKVKDEARQVARGSSTVLITGESGTGKELIARAIHAYSDRRKNPFVMVNCAAIPENLLESELFGYAPGAFTGADRNGKPGRFELAHRGTIFLDEIGDMSLHLQAKLLRFLQEKSFERVGGTRTVNVDVRIVSATNKDLSRAIKEGKFREDLFYRLNVIHLRMPPLRDRPEDLEPLVGHILNRLNRIMHTNISGVTADVLEILKNYHWPGNVRELENVLERAANYALEGPIRPSHLPPYLLSTGMGEAEDENPGEDTLKYRVRCAEREAILKALEKTGGNKTRAARLLNMSRSRLYIKLERLGIKC
ncbi:MAG: sigma 54-interacting transcriptional regulator [Peptococcaceae bacterium]|nr:sigma 54-interacting transcriptional regulator [Peptococcaceae bacterium]